MGTPADSEARLEEALEEKAPCAGDEAIDVEAWRNRTTYEGFTEDSQQVTWFWETLEGFDNVKRARLLSWCRGCSALPPTGFDELSFILRRDSGANARLPVAHTCEFSVDMPEYSSIEELRGKLLRAIEEEAFHIS